ncbi:MAG: AraC family transcriptional regulator [Staphylococcus sp.]|nr:AraC family transcriptional regulator [Staphylococcus sp.]
MFLYRYASPDKFTGIPFIDEILSHNFVNFIEGMTIGCALCLTMSLIAYRHKRAKSTRRYTQIGQPIKLDDGTERPDPVAVRHGIFHAAIKEWIAKKGFLNPDLTLNDMARELCTNKTYVSSFINKEYGVNFKQWLISMRMEYSMTLLKEWPVKYPIKEIAFLSGFGSDCHYIRLFGKKMGKSPVEWRECYHNSLLGIVEVKTTDDETDEEAEETVAPAAPSSPGNEDGDIGQITDSKDSSLKSGDGTLLEEPSE